MNQILVTKSNKNDKDFKLEPYSRKSHYKRDWFKFQFAFSLCIITLSILGTSFYLYQLSKKEDFSDKLLANYNIYRLYSSREDASPQENPNGLFGIIEIPKINLYYPVFSELTEELLKISPCKFYGDTPANNGNICIAGHNYDNSLFFSKISSLSSNDEIFIFDNNGMKYIYFVYDIYEVSQSDLSPVLNYEINQKILTLVTCNNFNSNRIIIKAKQK